MAWHLNPALSAFRSAVDAAYPHRDKASDGAIGDEAHQSRPSDHNPDADGSVDAWDMDVEVNGAGRPYAADVERLKRVFEQHESSKYWIHNDEIAFRDEGWKPRSYAYAGPSRNRHTKHVHYNTRETHERSTAPWPVDGDDMTPDQAEQLRDAHFVLARAVPNPTGTGRVPLHVWAAWHTGAMKALTATVAQLAQAVATGAGVSPEALQAAVKAAVEQSAQAVAEAVVNEQADRLQE